MQNVAIRIAEKKARKAEKQALKAQQRREAKDAASFEALPPHLACAARANLDPKLAEEKGLDLKACSEHVFSIVAGMTPPRPPSPQHTEQNKLLNLIDPKDYGMMDDAPGATKKAKKAAKKVWTKEAKDKKAKLSFDAFVGIPELQHRQAMTIPKRKPFKPQIVPKDDTGRTELKIKLQERMDEMRRERRAAEKAPKDEKKAKAAPMEEEDDTNVDFGRFMFGDERELERKRPPATVLLRQVEAKKRRDERDGPEAVQKSAWEGAMSRASGIKVRDDPALLKKTIRKEKAQKKRSAKQWAARTAASEGSGQKAKKHGKPSKRPPRPGFEGRKSKAKYGPKRSKK